MDVTTNLASPGRGVALLAASAAVPGTFARSLSPRSWVDQGLITGLSAGTHYLLTILAHDVLALAGEAVAPLLPLPRDLPAERREQIAVLAAELTAVPAGLLALRLLPRRDGEVLGLGLVRQSAWRLGATGVGAGLLGLANAGTAALDGRTAAGGRMTRLPVAIPLGLAAAMINERLRHSSAPPDAGTEGPGANPLLGLAAAGGVVGALTGAAAVEGAAAQWLSARAARRLPGSQRLWTLATHGAAAGVLATGVHQLWSRAMRKIEAGTSSYEPVVDAAAVGRWTTPMTSGDPASLVAWEDLGREGRRHALAVVRTATIHDRPEAVGDLDLSIATVMGRPALAEPIQVYVGLDNAPTATDRVELALAELDRTGAWDRSLLMLVSPTGTGYVNYVATAAVQYLTLGDVATVTLQYSKRPSPLSLGKIDDAREQNRLLWFRISERIRDLPLERRPRVVVFGESLGAHTSQDVFMHWGTLGPQALGIERALWIGTPYGSKWKQEVTGAPRADVNRDLVTVVNDFGQIEAMEPDRRARLRYVLLSHDNDGVTKFGPDLLVERPAWLGPDRPAVEQVPPASPRGIPASMRWRPVTSFFASLVDMKNAQVPGAYRAWAHDYRPDLPAFLREVYDLPATDDDLLRVSAALEQREAARQALFD